MNKKANPVRGDAYQMPFADDNFDIINVTGVFDEELYPHNFLKLIPEMARVLKAGGILSINELNNPSVTELENFFKRLSAEGKEFPTLWEKK